MTRYPKGQKGAKWTVKQLEAVTSEWKGDLLSDGQGLSGEVRVSSGLVSVVFRYAFKWQGKVCWHYCGTFPHSDLAHIRNERDHARNLLQSGVDPRTNKVAAKIEAQAAVEAVVRAEQQRKADALSFQDLYDAWIKDGVARSDDNKYLIQTFSKHALPALGNIQIRDLTEHHLRNLYRSIISSGRITTAYELSKDIGQMLRWAEKRKPWRPLLVEGNPSELVEIGKLLPKDYQRERDRVLSVEEIKKLHQIFIDQERLYDEATNKYEAERPLKKEVQISVWLCLSTLCRIGELLKTEWRHVNFEERTWTIPAENTKGQRGKKNQQTVYLSDFAYSQFKELHKLTGDTIWAFPARYKEGHVCVKSASKQIGDRQIKFKSRSKKLLCRVENNSLVLSDEEWTPHDLRRTGATQMQRLKISRDVINLCQNHVIGSKVDKHYLHHDFADEKRDAWDKLGNWLEETFA